MTSSSEAKIKQMSEEIDSSSAALRTINEKLRSYYDRLEVICKQHRRRMPIKDITFQEEFRATVLELKDFADKSDDFWQQTRAFFRTGEKATLVEANRIGIKQMNIGAMAFSRQVDELYTVFKNIQSLAREVPLRLNWWLLEASCEDLTKISGRILFLIRDLEKYL